MLKIFKDTDVIFTSNGDKILKPLKCYVDKTDNGNYYVDIEASLEYIDYLIQDNIVVASTPTGEQAFRLENPEKKKNKIVVRGWHVYYDSENLLIEDSYVVEKNCNDALDHLNSNTSDISPFITISDITAINSYRCVRTSLNGAISVVLDRWGGHLVRDNFKIEIRNQIGQDNGVVIRYRKNLKDINCQEDWSNVVTKLLPVGKDGLMLPEKYVMADISYNLPYTKTKSFTQDIDEDNFKDNNGVLNELEYQQALIEDLRYQAIKYVEENKTPKINYTLKADLDKITDVGDVIQVIDERLKVNILTNVIRYRYDCILGKFVELEFGNFRNNINGLINNLNLSVERKISESNNNVKVNLEKELQEATSQIFGMLGNSYVIYDGDKILIVDRLPKEQAQNVIMINSAGIGFSHNGINNIFDTTWTIDGTLNMQNVNVINLVADMIKGGTLKLGGDNNINGSINIFDNEGNLVGKIDNEGISYSVASEVKTTNGLTFDNNGLRIYTDDNSFNAIYNNEKTEYKDGNKVLQRTDRNGTITKDMVLYGTYYYGVHEDVNLDPFDKDDAMFVGQMYTDENNEECFGHFYNGGNV